jgi:RNA polymerase sigma-70 factor (ECF subfamily)
MLSAMRRSSGTDAGLDSFEAVALPHMKDLYRTAAAVLRDPAQAQDMVQETYLLAWKAFSRFTPGTNCRAWLFKILFHAISHHRRKWTNRFQYVESDTLEGTLVYSEPIPEGLTDEDILAALAKVPQHFAEVVLLADVHEFTYKEIEETLNIPIGTVMSRLSRGISQLRAHLAKTHRDESAQGRAVAAM